MDLKFVEGSSSRWPLSHGNWASLEFVDLETLAGSALTLTTNRTVSYIASESITYKPAKASTISNVVGDIIEKKTIMDKTDSFVI